MIGLGLGLIEHSLWNGAIMREFERGDGEVCLVESALSNLPY